LKEAFREDWSLRTNASAFREDWAFRTNAFRGILELLLRIRGIGGNADCTGRGLLMTTRGVQTVDGRWSLGELELEAFRTNQRGATPHQTLGIGAPSRQRGLGYIVHSRVTEESLAWAHSSKVQRPE